jgi:hypothetical protein
MVLAFEGDSTITRAFLALAVAFGAAFAAAFEVFEAFEEAVFDDALEAAFGDAMTDTLRVIEKVFQGCIFPVCFSKA